MWLFTKFGFFSVVCVRNLKGAVFVRARVREDLETFKKKYLSTEAHKKSPSDRYKILVDRKADYPYRLIVKQTVFSEVMFAIASEIDYSNFKDKVAETQGKERAWFYSKVWQTLANLEGDLEMVSGGLSKLP